MVNQNLSYNEIHKLINAKHQFDLKESQKYALGLPLKEERNRILIEHEEKYKIKAFPIGTYYKPYHMMTTSQRQDMDNYFFFPIDSREVITTLFLSIAGTFKTRLMKRFAYYYQKAGYNEFIFDSKSDDWYSARYVGDTWGLYKGWLAPEVPDRMKIKSYIASFAEGSGKVSPVVAEKFSKAGNSIRYYDHPRDWRTLGFGAGSSGAGPTAIRQLIKRAGIDTVEKMFKILTQRKKLGKYNIQGITGDAIVRRLDPIIHDGYFDEKNKMMPINRLWSQGYAISYHFFSQDPRYAQTLVGKTMQSIWESSEKMRQKIGEHGSPKLIICDDAGAYAGSEDMVENLAAYYLTNAINLWRRSGFNMMFGVQGINLISKHILDGIKHIFIGRIGNPMELLRFGITEEIYRNIIDLNYAPEKRIIEMIHVHPNRKQYTRFFPLNCPIGHEASV